MTFVAGFLLGMLVPVFFVGYLYFSKKSDGFSIRFYKRDAKSKLEWNE